MKVCLVCVEIFAWGKIGGFGRATRKIGKELVKRGVQVTAVVPRRAGQQPEEWLDGIRVLSFLPSQILSAIDLYRQADADIYHSQEPSFGTYLAQRAMPGRRHVITFRDTRTLSDWRIELALPSLHPLQVIGNYVYEENWLVRQAVRRADALFVTSRHLGIKAQKKYRLKREPILLPTPVDIPGEVEKAAQPTVIFNTRLDRRKRPELFFELARQFPAVHFLTVGKSRDPRYFKVLKNKYGSLPNLEMTGFLDQFEDNQLSQLLGRSWVMVNTAAREGLPTAFIEAAAHHCAILSALNPDGFAEKFGYHASQDDFAAGLQYLLENERWRDAGRLGYEYVRATYESSQAIDKHMQMYQELLNRQ